MYERFGSSRRNKGRERHRKKRNQRKVDVLGGAFSPKTERRIKPRKSPKKGKPRPPRPRYQDDPLDDYLFGLDDDLPPSSFGRTRSNRL